jgi:hypothetical protein
MKLACPSCGSGKLRGRPDGEVVHVTCKEGEHRWTHDPWACPTCGRQMYAARRPLLEKARGTQQSIVGYVTDKVCTHCDPPEDRLDGWMSAT